MNLIFAQPSKPFWPARWWWLLLAIIVLFAGGVRYVGYDFSLPYVDHPDEPNWNLAGRMIIDYGSAKPLNYHAYPPGIITINYVLLRFFHDEATPPSTLIDWVRLISITISLGTVILVALLAYRIATPLAGLLASGVWAIEPVMIDHSRFATADPYVTCFAALAIFCALSGTLYDRDRWTTAGIVAIMLAIVFKYQAGFLLPVVAGLPLLRLLAHPDQRRRVLTTSAYHAGYLVVFFFWLLAIYPTLDANDVPNWVAPTDEAGLPGWSTTRQNINNATDPLEAQAVFRLGLVSLGWLVWPRVRQQINGLALITVIAGAGAWFVGVGVFGEQAFRQFVAFTTLLIVLAGVGLALWAIPLGWLLEQLQTRWPATQRFTARPYALSLALGTVVMIACLPTAASAIDNAYNHTLPARRVDLATYMDASVPPGPYLSNTDNHKTFNRSWGGYPGEKEFPYARMALVTEQPLETWREQGVEYAIVPYGVYEEMQTTPAGQAYLDGMLLLKTYPPSDEYRGPDMAVFRLRPMQFSAAGQVGSTRQQVGPVRLVGYDIDRTEAQAGDTITFTLYWQADETTDIVYRVYNHLAWPDSRDFVGQADGSPLPNIHRGTNTWADPGETLISQSFTITVDPAAEPGEYRLITGFYHPETYQRLIGPDGDDFIRVTTITVLGEPVPSDRLID
ncbi:MAG: phospholipid carrier-dependent glycosyltransferase [Chloroflexi bacterium]|nr:phospholipid carrier-dependent glycosyltransferase [Chloroflexota bacterium]